VSLETGYRAPRLGPLHYAPPLETAGIEADLAALLAERGGFGGVVQLAPGDRSAPLEARRVAARERARRAGAEWLLDAAVGDARVELVEHTPLFGFKVFVLITSSVFIFPAVDPLNWFLASEVYGLKVRVPWRLIDLETEAVLAEGVVERTTSTTFAAFGLGGPSRSWFVVGFLRVPDCLEEEDWAEIAAQLAPRAREDLGRALTAAAEAAAAKARPGSG